MQSRMKHNKIKIIVFKGIRLLFIPLSLVIYYYTTKAWGDTVGLVMAVGFGGSYVLIVNSTILDVICGELKSGVEELIRRVTHNPVYIEFGRNWGKMSFLVFIQEDNETVIKVVYRKIVELLKSSEYFGKIQIFSMANVPNLEKETIKRYRKIMLNNAIEMAERKRKEK